MKIQALQELKETLENYYPNQDSDDNSYDFVFDIEINI